MLTLIALAALQSQTTTEVQPDWVRKDHQATIGGKVIQYQTTAGLMPIRAHNGDVEGRIFFVSYRRTQTPGNSKRPILFLFNGGPGSASVWLHMGLAGPYRTKMGTPEGFMPPPPYQWIPNDESLLPDTDIVTIDPVGTGYSYPEKPELGAKFWSVDGDISSVGEFIRSYLTTENRWLSPIFVMGESYGGIRGAGLASWLHGHGVGLNGLILVSPYLGTIAQDGGKGNEAPYAFNLPTYATSAWYHKKLSPSQQRKPLNQIYRESLDFVYDEYLPVLERGSRLSESKRRATLDSLQSITGLSKQYLEDTNLRISDNHWYKELMRKDRYVMGRYDSRFVGFDRVWNTDSPDNDPSYSQVSPPFTSTINDYLNNEIGYRTTKRYYILGEGITGPWKNPDGILDESESLRVALSENPYTKVMVAMGYYDLACPMGSVDQVLDKMELDRRLKDNIVRHRYPAGHMIYLDDTCRRNLSSDIASFIRQQSSPTLPAGVLRKN